LCARWVGLPAAEARFVRQHTEIMATRAEFAWTGLTLRHRTFLTGTDLSPEWALVRVRRFLEGRRGTSSGEPATGDLKFEETASTVQVTGAFLPSVISGDVTATRTADGIVVAAAADLTGLILGIVVSVFGAAALFAFTDWLSTPLFALWEGVVLLASTWHVWKSADALRTLTAVGTRL